MHLFVNLHHLHLRLLDPSQRLQKPPETWTKRPANKIVFNPKTLDTPRTPTTSAQPARERKNASTTKAWSPSRHLYGRSHPEASGRGGPPAADRSGLQSRPKGLGGSPEQTKTSMDQSKDDKPFLKVLDGIHTVKALEVNNPKASVLCTAFLTE
uniref:Kinesin motor domain-containing protein n=1 Tax=Steinernema glaseri TaxID=37863 RepID=A0A1I8A6F1_9BILA